MFRRFGFRWLETSPEIKDSGWRYGYGEPLREYSFIKENFLSENEYFINLTTTKENGYDPEKIIEYLNIEN